MSDFIIYTDGGSRGNPGPAAFGVAIRSSDGLFHEAYGHYMGVATNNEAEYSAVISGLQRLHEVLGSKSIDMSVELRADSELMVRQMNGIYKVKNERIGQLFLKVWHAKSLFKSVKFVHVRREFNKEADAMVNKALDDAMALPLHNKK